VQVVGLCLSYPVFCCFELVWGPKSQRGCLRKAFVILGCLALPCRNPSVVLSRYVTIKHERNLPDMSLNSMPQCKWLRNSSSLALVARSRSMLWCLAWRAGDTLKQVSSKPKDGSTFAVLVTSNLEMESLLLGALTCSCIHVTAIGVMNDVSIAFTTNTSNLVLIIFDCSLT
jgi:hypothetical protein